MSTWRARLGVVVIFVVGFLCGGVTVSLVAARAQNKPDAWIERVTRHLGRRLDLTREQREQVRAALLDARRDSRASLQRVEPEMVANFDRTQERIRSLLTPAQQKKFEQISARRRAKFLERFGEHLGHGGGPGRHPHSAPSSQPQ